MSKAIRFEVWRDEQLVDAATLTQDVIKIGRLPSSHLYIDDESVARMHAVIEVQGDNLRLVDLGSTVGTAVNGQRVQKTTAVRLGDSLSVGPYQVRIAAPVVQATRPSALPGAEAFEQTDAAEVAEVMAVYGDTVLDVQHIGQRTRRQGATALLALGGVLLLGGVGYFASQTAMQGEAWQTYEVAKAEAAQVGRPAPTAPGTGWAGIGLALGLVGLVPLGLGAARLSDRDRSRYTIGEGENPSFSTAAAALPNPGGFPLVSAEDGGETSIQFAPGMDGHVTVQGERYSLEDLVTSGQAVAQGSAFTFPLPRGARCRIQHDDVTFHVNAVKPGKVVAGRGSADKNFWMYNAASFIALGSLLGLAQLALPAAGDFSLDDAQSFNRFVGYIHQPDKDIDEPDDPDEQPLEDGKELSEPGDPGKRAPGAEGAMGNPDSKVAEPKRFAMKGPKDAPVQMSRTFSPDVDARQQGILGVIQSDSGHFLASPNGGAFSVGHDDADVWGGLTGTDIGETHGTGGLGLVGTGRSGGGTADGVLGLGTVGTIGTRGSGGDGIGYTRGKGAGFDHRERRKPAVRVAKSTVSGALDKDIVRRVVRAHINQVRHCYNQGLTRDPTLRGRVAIQFTIGRTGKVPMAIVSKTTLKDRNVGNCVAKAVKRWKFPKPDGGGTVMVTYPFVLNPG